jgi:hypothetical protein
MGSTSQVIGFGASIAEAIPEHLFDSWLDAAIGDNWKAVRASPPKKKASLKDFLSESSNKVEAYIGPAALTDTEIMSWSDGGHDIDVESDITRIVANGSAGEMLAAFRMYLQFIIQLKNMHEDYERDSCMLLVDVNGPFREILVQAYEHQRGEPTTLEDIEGGNADISVDDLLAYLAQPDVDEEIQNLGVWWWLKAIDGRAAAATDFESPPTNLNRDFRALVQEKAESVFQDVGSPEGDSDAGSVEDDDTVLVYGTMDWFKVDEGPSSITDLPPEFAEAKRLWSADAEGNISKVIKLLQPFLGARFLPINISNWEELFRDAEGDGFPEIEARSTRIAGIDYSTDVLPRCRGEAVFVVPATKMAKTANLEEWQSSNGLIADGLHFYWDVPMDQECDYDYSNLGVECLIVEKDPLAEKG